MSTRFVLSFFFATAIAVQLKKQNAPKKLVSTNVDPDEYIPTCQLARSKGYPCQEFNVTTEDGYILTIHRIPFGVKSPGAEQTTGKPVAYLQHGLLDCSATWVMNFANESLGYLLADAGYDVWMGNMRGNTYGKNHVKYTTDESVFWEFTFDEMAKFDLPAIAEFALDCTNQSSLYYVGHSQGTLIGFIKFSMDPVWAQTKFVLELFGEDEFLPSNRFMEWLGGTLCTPEWAFLCENVLMLIVGYDKRNMNETRNPVYMTHAPAGTSTYNIVHFSQLMTTDRIQAMDWGYFDNEKYYNSHSPLQYYLNTMTVPVALYWGDIDIFADPTDVIQLQSELQHVIGSYRYPEMDHLDFVWGMNAASGPYTQMLQLVSAKIN